MDTSETYVRMANHPKIQEQWDKTDNEFSISYKDKNIWISHEGNFTYKAEIWLPRQDQIQKMIGKTESAFCIYRSGNRWGGEIYRDREQVFTIEMDSPEQLWLAFYMDECHKLVWYGEKWDKK